MKQANDAVKHSRFYDLVFVHGQNVADQHVFEVFGFARSLAHGQNGSGGGHSIGDTDENLLRNVVAAGACEGKDRGSYEG
jgi:hypothetical protein